MAVSFGVGRFAHPLHVKWQGHYRIFGNQVSIRPMEKMRPFIYFIRPQLYRPGPSAILLDVGQTSGAQHAQHLFH